MKHQGGKNLRGNLVLVSYCSLEESEAQKGVHLLSELRGTEQVCGTQASSPSHALSASWGSLPWLQAQESSVLRWCSGDSILGMWQARICMCVLEQDAEIGTLTY